MMTTVIVVNRFSLAAPLKKSSGVLIIDNAMGGIYGTVAFFLF